MPFGWHFLTWEEKTDTSSFAKAVISRTEGQKGISKGRENLPWRELAISGFREGCIFRMPIRTFRAIRMRETVLHSYVV